MKRSLVRSTALHVIPIYIIIIGVFFACLTSICAGPVLAVDGYSAYRSNTGIDALSSPKIRYWNSTANSGNGSWGNEIELSSAGSPIRFAVLKQSPADSKIALVTQSDDGYLDGYVCMKQCGLQSSWNLTPNIGYVGITAQKMFDFSFESSSGDLLLIYSIVNTGTTSDIAYKELPKNMTWFDSITEQYLDDTGHAIDIQYTWLDSDPKPLNTSDEILIAGFDSSDDDINAWIWNGTAFGAINEISATASATLGYKAFACRYSADSTKGMVAAADGTTGLVRSQYWSSGAWTIPATFDPIASGQGQNDDEIWLTLKADPSTDDLQLVLIDSGASLHTSYWDGTVWSVTTRIDNGVDSTASRPADFAWLPTGNSGRLVWDTDAAGTTLSEVACTPSCTGTIQTISTYANTGSWLSLYTNPYTAAGSAENVKFLGLRLTASPAFDIGAFSYNGSTLSYSNYGDTSMTADVSSTLYESYDFGFRRDLRKPSITFIKPNATGISSDKRTLIFNVTSDEYLQSCILEFNGTNMTMGGSDLLWNYSFSNLVEATYSYRVYSRDLAGNMNVSERRNITIDYHLPTIRLIAPANNTLNNYSRNTTFYYNVTDTSDNISSCILFIDGMAVVSRANVSKNITVNFTYAAGNGQHNWSIWCNDTNSGNSTSQTRNLTVSIIPTILSVYLDDGMMPYGEVMLSAGSRRDVNCSLIVSDPDGSGFINNVSGVLYYSANQSSDPDDDNVHYTVPNCTVASSTANNKSFSCQFHVMYHANNGTWKCNLSVNAQDVPQVYSNMSTLILPLYAINVSDGITFTNAASGFPSDNITVNITNFGNMPINVTLQGYAMIIGDNVGMNCSDKTNITITNIRFSAYITDDFAAKTPLDGSLQRLDFNMPKQASSAAVFNTTYWQIDPDPGKKNRICEGYVVFNAEAS